MGSEVSYDPTDPMEENRHIDRRDERGCYGAVPGWRANARYASFLMREADETDNPGVTQANTENAVRALLIAAEKLARAATMPKTATDIMAAWRAVDTEARS